MTESEALALIRQLLADALSTEADTVYVRTLAANNGELRATMRTAITIIDRLGGTEVAR